MPLTTASGKIGLKKCGEFTKMVVLGGTTNCVPRQVPLKNTAVLGSTVTVLLLLPQPVSLLA